MSALLIQTIRHGQATYAIAYEDGREPMRHHGGDNQVIVPITDDQAGLGIDVCAALFETGRLK